MPQNALKCLKKLRPPEFFPTENEPQFGMGTTVPKSQGKGGQGVMKGRETREGVLRLETPPATDNPAARSHSSDRLEQTSLKSGGYRPAAFAMRLAAKPPAAT